MYRPTTVQKWRKRTSVADRPMGPAELHSTVLGLEQEVVIVAFRRRTLLPLDDCLSALQATIPGLARAFPASVPAAMSHWNAIGPRAKGEGHPVRRSATEPGWLDGPPAGPPLRQDLRGRDMVAPLVQATMSRGIGHRLTRPTPPGAARIGKQSGGVFSRAAVRSSGCFAAFASRRLPANRTARSGRRPSNGPTMTTTTSCETTSRSSLTPTTTPTTTPEDGRPAKA